MITATKAILCKYCYDLLYPTHDCYAKTYKYDHKKYDSDLPAATLPEQCSSICSCGNVAVIVDEDTHWHIYVDDIRTTQRAILYHNGDFKEISRELLQPFSQAIYTDYSYVRHHSIKYQPLAKKNKYIRKTSTTYNTKLIKALDHHKHTTSDGTEPFLRTTRNNPLKA